MIPKILPLLTLDSSKNAYIIGSLLVKNGFNAVEVTFRTDAAPEVILELSKVERLLIGAGTVITVEQVNQAISNGAKFIITPGINRDVIEYCLASNTPVYPGVVTPSEIEICREYGLSTLKLFPAGIFGGLKLIKAYYGPYKDFNFIPTGGINLENAIEYLNQPNVASIGGSFLLNSELIEKNDWETLNYELKEMSEVLNDYLPK